MKTSSLPVLFSRLHLSSFRSQFHLNKKDYAYFQHHGLPVIMQHAHSFIAERLAPAAPKKDGRQTPWHGHPVFVAQHATACCCRGCLEKWHSIPKGKTLTTEEQEYILSILQYWLENSTNHNKSG